jgi:hypothetical protein
MAAVTAPQGSPSQLGLTNVGQPEQVESNKQAAFRNAELNGGPVQGLTDIGAGLHAHLAANVAAEGVGINISSSA